MSKLIEQGKINGILTWKMDRLSRNAIDSGAIQYFLQKKPQLIYIVMALLLILRRKVLKSVRYR
jgi:hypothetical protein